MGAITEAKHANTRRFFPATTHVAHLDAMVALRDPDLRSLVEHLMNAGASTQGALVPSGFALSSVQARLERLTKAGLVASTRKGRHRLYECTPLAVAMIHGGLPVALDASKEQGSPAVAYA
jgi:predicted transcriptional regulator